MEHWQLVAGEFRVRHGHYEPKWNNTIFLKTFK
jgi:hypothetical protein